MSSVPTLPGKYVPHTTLHEGWTYFEPGDSEYIIGFKQVVTKVLRGQTPEGKPGLNGDGTPSYTWQTQTVTRTLTRAEYEVQRKMEARR